MNTESRRNCMPLEASDTDVDPPKLTKIDGVFMSEVLRSHGLEDTGKRDVASTGALRETDDPERGYYELLPPEALERLAVLYAKGSQKYAARNWEKGLPFGRTVRAMLRHGIKYLAGNRQEDHLAAVAWNAFALMTYEERIKTGELPESLNDLPKRVK